MSAATVAVNPPLPFTKNAIINQLRHQATNGPAYVQHGATKALAHLKGLYAEARYEARHAFEAARDAIRDAAREVINQGDEPSPAYRRAMELMDGAELTEADLGGFAQMLKQTDNEEEEEEGSNNDDAEAH